jgi:hypothetical protein
MQGLVTFVVVMSDFSFLFIYLCIYFGNTGVSIQGFALSRQALHLLRHASSPYVSSFFLSFFCGAGGSIKPSALCLLG